MHVLPHHLLLGQVLAMVAMHLDPVLLLALLGTVADELAPGTPEQLALIRWLFPAIDITVRTAVFKVIHSESQLLRLV